MKFIDAKQAIVNLVGSNANGEFRVVGYEPFPQDAKDFVGKNRTVRIFYSGGKFDGAITTPVAHDIEMMLEMVAVAKNKVDLDILDDPNSTQIQRAAALAGTQPAAEIVDASMDEFISLLWNILMAPQNQWLGLGKYVIGNRMVKEIKKDRLVPVGKMAILTAYMSLSFSIQEVSKGIKSNTFEGSVTNFNPINGDTVQKTIINND